MAELSLAIALTLAVLAVFQGWLAVALIRALLSFRRRPPDNRDCPKAAVVLCLRGRDPFLEKCLESVLSRAKVVITHDVLVDRLSITDKIHALVDRLEQEGSFTFESCFAFVESGLPLVQLKQQVVVTFLAILEMTRLKLIRLSQPEARGSIYVTRAADDLREQASKLSRRNEEYQ